jgi:hypothetical protein
MINLNQADISRMNLHMQNLIDLLKDFNQTKVDTLVEYNGGEVLNPGSKD